MVNFQDAGQVQAADNDYYQTQQELVKSRTVLEAAAGQPAVKAMLEGKGEGEAPRRPDGPGRRGAPHRRRRPRHRPRRAARALAAPGRHG